MGRTRSRVLAFIALVTMACVGKQFVPRVETLEWRTQQGRLHDWWSERGPVVPHGTFPADCRLCHLAGDWHQLRPDFSFDHGAETGVILEGAHASAQCLRCHNDRGPIEEFAQRSCVGCHADVHQGARGTGCAQCHGQADWRVDKDLLAHARTRFPLLGPHAAAQCRDCHVGIDGGVLEPLDTACASCHLDDLARALEPNHVALGWTASCERCHQVSTFSGAGFLHTGFRLDGAHAAADCSQCHVGGVFAGTPSDCFACHGSEYQAAQNPNHVLLGIPTSCQQCHGTSTWSGAAFSHTVWPLTGAHAASSCNECHGGGVFTGTPTACVACHQAEYNATTSPNHGAAGFAQTCQDCHSTSMWRGAEFDHDTWPLTGAHGSASCSSCHGGGVFAGTPTNCVACHLADFNATTSPPHVSAGFPTSCQDCHNTSMWNGATFHHTWFPITSGAHRDFSCISCHLVPGNTSTFSCTHCHEHRESEMSSEHQGVNGYVWQSNACYQCHPDGRESAHGFTLPPVEKRERSGPRRPSPDATDATDATRLRRKPPR